MVDSFAKISVLPDHPSALDEEQLETWESFASRHARVVELFLARYIRAAVLDNDPGFDGTLRDFVNRGEKTGLVDDADAWMRAARVAQYRSPREYSDQDTAAFLSALKQSAPRLLALQARL